jgi:hypothetical protein
MRDIFLAKCDKDGNWLWGKAFGSTDEDYSRGVGVDAQGGIYMSGCFTGTVPLDGQPLTSKGATDIFLAKFNPSGLTTWAKRMGGAGPDEGCEIRTDPAGYCYLSGGFAGRADFLGRTLTGKGSRDLFMAKFDSSGSLVWLTQAGGTEDDENYAVALHESTGSLVTMGTFFGTATFDGFTLTSAGNADFFVAWLGQVLDPIPPSLAATATILKGIMSGTAPFTVTVGGQPAQVSGSAWSIEIPLNPGTNTFTVKVADALGQEAQQTITIQK